MTMTNLRNDLTAFLYQKLLEVLMLFKMFKLSVQWISEK